MKTHFTKTQDLTKEQVTETLKSDPNQSFGWTYLRGRTIKVDEMTQDELTEMVTVGGIYMTCLEEQIRTMALTCVCTAEEARVQIPGEEPRETETVLEEARDLANHAMREVMKGVATRMSAVMPGGILSGMIEEKMEGGE